MSACPHVRTSQNTHSEFLPHFSNILTAVHKSAVLFTWEMFLCVNFTFSSAVIKENNVSHSEAVHSKKFEPNFGRKVNKN